VIVDTTDRPRELPKLGARLRAQVASGDGAAGVWLPLMSCWFRLRLPHLGGFPDYQLRCCHGFSTSATASGRRARGPRVPPAVVSPQHGIRTT
jgi:hypothetical protein